MILLVTSFFPEMIESKIRQKNGRFCLKKMRMCGNMGQLGRKRVENKIGINGLEKGQKIHKFNSKNDGQRLEIGKL